jgi:sugar-specific transcriptional regulator TrmB
MIDILQEVLKEIKSLKKELTAENVKRISKKNHRKRAESLGIKWFSEISESLVSEHGFRPDLIEAYSQQFARLIKISAPNNLKNSYIETLKELGHKFRDELIIPIQKRPRYSSDASLLEKMLQDIQDPKEDEYLKEAVNCARRNYYRAAVVLGWCAAIDRIHHIIEKNGFTIFNVTSSSMASQVKGRFKRFKSPQNIASLSELREVFDTIVMWILEGMQLIDSNQHTRLRSCFDLRCQCAHPGDAPVTEYNLLSYFSDLNEIIFKSDAFQI